MTLVYNTTLGKYEAVGAVPVSYFAWDWTTFTVGFIVGGGIATMLLALVPLVRSPAFKAARIVEQRARETAASAYGRVVKPYE